MASAQQIDVLKKTLAAIDTAIAQTKATCGLAIKEKDLSSLETALVELKLERSLMRGQLKALERAAVPAGNLPTPARARTIRKRLDAVSVAAPVVKVTIGFADDVTRLSRELRLSGGMDLGRRPKEPTAKIVGDSPHVPGRKRKPKPKG
jgi:hypothetical protein